MRMLPLGSFFVAIVAVQAFAQSPLPPAQDAAPVAKDAIAAPAAAPNVELMPAHELPPFTPPTPPGPQTGGAPMMFDAEMVRRGEAAFNQQCTQCHEAGKSLEKAKSFPEWMATVKRMAEKPDASIPTDQFEPIAAYLTTTNPPAPTSPASALLAGMLPGLNFNGTFSPTWRGGNSQLQNGGFFPDVWLGVNWNNGSPVSARATACLSCHNDGGSGSTIELVDAVARIDAMQAFGWQHPRIKLSAEAGRFIVPFGAFAAQSNPGVYRTVTRPLMYNMGMRVRDGDLGDPVLPMPYSDEGASFNVGLPVTSFVNFSFDGYIVNGLQGTADGVDFDMSRSYNSLNSLPSVGGRATLGNEFFKLGTSAIGGTFSPTGGVGPNGQKMGYHIFGADASFRYRDLFRVQAEYARRSSDHLRGDPAAPINAPDVVDGMYVESEVLLLDFLRTSLLFRYDWQRQGANIPAFLPVPVNGFSVERYTTGLNFTLRGGSLLMFNYEYWRLPAGFDNLSVYGIRWAATF